MSKKEMIGVFLFGVSFGLVAYGFLCMLMAIVYLIISIFANHLAPKIILALIMMITGVVMMYRINKGELK